MKMRIVTLFLLLLSSVACAAHYYMDPAGNDANQGTQAAPWLTLRHAFSAGLKAGDTVHVNDGDYTFTSDSRVTIPRGLSGTVGAPITFVGDGNATMIGTETPPWVDYGIQFTDNAYIVFQNIGFKRITVPIRIFNTYNKGATTWPGGHHLTFQDISIEDAGHSGGGFAVQGRAFAIGDYDPNNLAASSHHITITGGTVTGGSEIGIQILGGPHDIDISACTITNINDGKGVSGDGDAITILAKAGRVSDNIKITAVSISDCSEDGLDLTGTNITVDRVTIRNVGACGAKAWSPAKHGGGPGQGSFTILSLDANAAQSGLECKGAPKVTIAHSTLMGHAAGDYGLYVGKDGMSWDGPVAASYSIYNTKLVAGGAILTETNCITGSGTRLTDLRADANGDGRVTGLDFLVWQANYPKTSGGTKATGDFNGDDKVNGADFLIWQAGSYRQ